MPAQGAGPRMNKLRALIGIVIIIIVVIVAVSVVSFFATPDFDTIIENKDCGAALRLTEWQLASATVDQQVKLTFMITGCMLGGSG